MARKARLIQMNGRSVALPQDARSSQKFVDQIIANGVIQGNKAILWLPGSRKGGKHRDRRVDLTFQRIGEVVAHICDFYKIPKPASFAAAS